MLTILAFLATVPVVAASTTASAQPSPRIIAPAICPSPTEVSEEVTATVKFRTQQKAAQLERFVTNRKLKVTALGWEWGDHVTYFPVADGKSMREAAADLARYQEDYLSSLVQDLPKLQERLTEVGYLEAAADAQLKHRLYGDQLAHVQNNPIEIAAIYVVAPLAQAQKLMSEQEAVVVDCRTTGKGIPSRIGGTPDPVEEIHPMSNPWWYSWAPRVGDIIVRADTANGGPYIRNFDPLSFMECRTTKTISLPPGRDCYGPWSHNFPSTTAPYLDTRANDTGTLEDYTIGLEDARNLVINQVYTTTVYTIVQNNAPNQAWVELAPQRSNWPKNSAQQAFCAAYTWDLGRPQACLFADTILLGGGSNIYNGMQNWWSWDRVNFRLP